MKHRRKFCWSEDCNIPTMHFVGQHRKTDAHTRATTNLRRRTHTATPKKKTGGVRHRLTLTLTERVLVPNPRRGSSLMVVAATLSTLGVRSDDKSACEREGEVRTRCSAVQLTDALNLLVGYPVAAWCRPTVRFLDKVLKCLPHADEFVFVRKMQASPQTWHQSSFVKV